MTLVSVHDLELTYDSLYIKMRSDNLSKDDIKKRKAADPDAEIPLISEFSEADDRVRAINFIWENKMNFENSELDYHFTMKNIFFQKIKNYCKLSKRY